MNDEYERLLQDRDLAEQELEYLERELHMLEKAHPEDPEGADGWDDLHMQCLELENELTYLNHCIEDSQDQ